MARPRGSGSNAAERLLEAAGRGFRAGGYGGVGVDGLAREAGLTSGAFYAHFKSKTDAFRAIVEAGLSDLQAGIRGIRDAHGRAWVAAFVDFYLTDRLTCDLAQSCALQSLTGDVARAEAATRRAYKVELDGVLRAMTDGDGGLDRSQALALLAMLSGGVTMARAADDAELADEIAAALRAACMRLANPRRRR